MKWASYSTSMRRRVKVYSPAERATNFRFVARTIGVLCAVQIPFLLISLLFSYYYNDDAHSAFWWSIAVAFVMGVVLTLLGRNNRRYSTGRKESMLTVSVSWIIISLIGMLPYCLGGYLPSVADAFFEAVSGYTTTGATMVQDVESLPRSLLFWRSVTQWQGGIGIIVFLIALIPMTGESASLVFNNETTGITHERFLPRVGIMAKWLVILYITFTAIGALLLLLGPMDLFNSVCHACTAIATGGFSTFNTSIAGLGYYSKIVLVILMLIGAVSFSLIYFALVKKEPKRLFNDPETRAFFFILFLFSALGILWHFLKSAPITDAGDTLFGIFVQLVSAITTTGYSVGDYNQWGTFFTLLLILAMFIAASIGSTSGGLKVMRLLVLWKATGVEFKKRVHPQAVIPVRVGKQVVPSESVVQTFNFFFIYVLLIVFAMFMLALEGINITDALGASVACVSNSGALIGELGPVGNCSSLTVWNKFMLSILMIIGRLEIFTFLTVLQPSFWKH